MPEKTMDEYIFKVDWLDVKKKLTYGKVCGLAPIAIDFSDEFKFTMFGEKKMSPRQRDVLTKMNEQRVKDIKEKGRKKAQKILDTLETDSKAINANREIRRRDRPLEIAKLGKKAVTDITEVLKQKNVEIDKSIDNNIKGYVKGKHHKSKKTVQVVKHAIKVPLAVASVPLGVVLSAGVVTAPIGAYLLVKASSSITQAYNYTMNHKMGLVGISQRIKKNLEFVEGKSDEMAGYIAAVLDPKASGADKVKAYKMYKDAKKKLGEAEVVAYAFNVFLNQHSKSIQNLSDLVEKYRKKLNKYKFGVIQMGRKIDKLEDAIKDVNKDIDDREAAIRKGPAQFVNAGISARKMQPYLDKMAKKNVGCRKDIINMRKSIVGLEYFLDDEIALCVQRDIALEKFSKKLEKFKALRPKSVHHWKKAIKVAAFAELLTGFAVGEVDIAAGAAPGLLENIGNGVGRVGDSADAIKDTIGHLSNAYDKA